MESRRGAHPLSGTPSVVSSKRSGLDEYRIGPIAATARWTAAERARESLRGDRLFDDPYAEVLAGDSGRRLAEQLRGDGWDNPSIAVRTRFFDDAISSATGVTQLRQIVIIAAGMDTRAWRLGLPTESRLFELDNAELLGLKERLLDAVVPRVRRVAVPVDLSDSNWPLELVASGFTEDEPTVWVAEGLLAYLDSAAVSSLMDQITALSCQGSHFVADVLGESFLSSPSMRSWRESLAAREMPWLFGTDDPDGLFACRGWRPESTQMVTAAAQLKRPLPSVPESSLTSPRSYLVHANL